MRKYYKKFIDSYQKFGYAIAEEKLTKVIFCGLLLFFFILILVLNILYPIYGDDWRYSFINGSSLTQKVATFSDSIHSQYNHYLTHGGRSVVHLIAESLLRIRGHWLDVVNSIAYIIFVCMIYKISNINNKINLSLLFFINILIWFYQPAFGQTFLWITGSANYLWGTLIIISFLYFYCQAFISENSTSSVSKCFLFFVFGIIAGWTNENTAVGMLLIICLLILYLKIKIKKTPVWMIFGLVGALIGFFIMITAPGNFVRYENATANNNLIGSSKIIYYYTRLLPVIGEFYKSVFTLVLIYLLTLATYMHFEKSKNTRIIYLSLLFCTGGIIADLAMIASPEFEPRVLFGVITFFIIAIGLLYSNINTQLLYLSIIKSILIIFSIINFIPLYTKGYKDVYTFNQIMKQREEIINKQINKSDFELVTDERFTPITKFTMMYDMSPNPNEWDNISYSIYHNIKSIRIEQQIQNNATN